MPYIDRHERKLIDTQISQLIDDINHVGKDKQKSGLVNYAITRIIHEVYGLNYPSYDKINAAIGVLECAKQELYRKKAAPYEDEKILENGDV